MTLRVLHILDHSLPLQSGYTFRTLAILREQRMRGWDTLQLTSPKQGPGTLALETVENWTFHRTPADRGLAESKSAFALMRQMRATAARIGQLVRSESPHILHAHSPVLNAIPALWAGRQACLPVVYEVRALWEDGAIDHGTTSDRSLRYRMSRALETFALRNAHHVTTICEGLRGEIAARGVPADRITVIPNAVDVDAFRMDGIPDAALRDALGLRDRTVIGFAGSFYSYEGLHLLLEATARLASVEPRVAVLMLGGGPEERALRERAASLRIADRVVFTGRVPHSEVGRHYDLIDVLVYPRRSTRVTQLVTPLKPLEAMAQGRIVVASDVGGHRELIRDGETGWLFPADDAAALAAKLADVLARRAEWPEMQSAARRFVETERTWRASIARYDPVYSSLARPGDDVRALDPRRA